MINYRGYSVSRDFPCNCCGATFTDKPLAAIRTAGKGIRIISGKVGQPRQEKKLHITHIDTKNGPLTLVIREGV